MAEESGPYEAKEAVMRQGEGVLPVPRVATDANPAWLRSEDERPAICQQIADAIVDEDMALSECARLEGITPEQLEDALQLVLGEVPTARAEDDITPGLTANLDDDGAAVMRAFVVQDPELAVTVWIAARGRPSRMHLISIEGRDAHAGAWTLCGSEVGSEPSELHSGPCVTCITAAARKGLKPPSRMPSDIREAVRRTLSGKRHSELAAAHAHVA